MPVDPEVVSSLVLGGIINIINQHDKIAILEEKIRFIEMESTTTNVR